MPKFVGYYNKYRVTQPCYCCKACHRYWTQGGIVHNVPIGGGCCKNNKQQCAFVAAALGSAPTSSLSSSSGGSKKINTNTPQLMLMPTPAMATTDFPIVLPTLMSSTSSGLELPNSGSDHQHQVSLPFAPLSLPSNPPGNTLFMDAMRGGFLGDSGSGSRGMMPLPFLPPPSFGFGMMQLQGHGVMMGGSSSRLQLTNSNNCNNHHNSRGYCVDWQVGGGGGGLNSSSSLI
nr:unnamed protein product [Digitaria exilis]